MKVLSIVLAALHCIGGVLFAGDPEPVVFASYNVQNYIGGETAVRSKAAKPKAEAAIEALVQIVSEIHPDILGLCEMGGRTQLEDFAARLRNRGVDLPHSEFVEGPDNERHLALLSRFPISARASQPDLSYELNGALEKMQRGLLDVTIAVNEGYALRVVGAHLKSRLIAPQGEGLMRRYEAQLLRRHVDAILGQEESTNLLVYGDLNDSRNQPPIQEIVGVRGTPALLTDLAPEDELGDRWTHYWRTADEYSRFDYLLASRGLLPEIVRTSSRVYRSPHWNDASDHRPVFTSIVPTNKAR